MEDDIKCGNNVHSRQNGDSDRLGSLCAGAQKETTSNDT